MGQFDRSLLHVLVEIDNLPCLFRIEPGLLMECCEKEFNPTVPVRRLSAQHAQSVNIDLPVFLEIGRDMKHRPRKKFFLEEKKRNQHPPDSAVPIEKRMNDLELSVDDG